MTAALIAICGAFLAAVSYSIWSRIRIGKLYTKIENVTLQRDHAIREAELSKISLKTAEVQLRATEEMKTRADLAAARLRRELNDVLTLVAQGKLGDITAIRSKLDELLSQ